MTNNYLLLYIFFSFIFLQPFNYERSKENLSKVEIGRMQNTIADAGEDADICSDTYIFDANTPDAALSAEWSLVSGSGDIADINDPNSSISNIGIGINVFQWTFFDDGDPISSATVTITRDEAPTTANAGSNQSVCATSTTLSANATIVGTGQWSVLSGSGTFADSSDPNTSVSDLGTGENIFRWAISNGSCTPSTSDVTITRSETPIDFTAGTNQSICAANLTLQATLPNGATGLWSVISGTGTFADDADPESEVSGLSIGVNTFEWTVTSGACTASAQVSISSDETPTTANAGSNQSVCATSATLSANAPIVGTGQWSVLSGSGTFDDDTNPSTSVSDLGTGENIFRWAISNGSCTPSTSDVTITRSETPIDFTAGTNQSICSANLTLQATLPNGATGLWSVISGTGTFADASSPTSQVSGLSIGVNTFEWTVTSGACTASAQVSITRDETPTTANAGSNQSVCATSASLSANTPAVGTGQWSVLSGSGTFADSSDPNTSVLDLGTGENIFRWTISNGSCTPSTSDVTITRSETPIDFTAGTNQSVCSASFDLEATLPVGAAGLWTVISGTGTFADDADPESEVSGLSIGMNTFEWTVTSGACTASAQVSISRDEAPTTANAGSNQSVCATSAILSANTPTVGTGQWSVLSGSGTFADSSDPNTSVSSLGTGENIFRWTISNGSCTPSTSDVTITRSETPIDFTAGTNQSVCTASFDLEATLPVGANGLWTVISGTGIFADDADPESEVSGLSIGVNTFEWTVTSGACTASAQVSISRDETPTTANAGVNQSVCATSATLSANTPSIGTGQWSVLSGSGTFADSSDPNTSVSDLGTGENIFRWTISNGSCTPSISDVTIARSETPIDFTAGTNQSVCSASFDLEATLPVGATGLWTVISGTGIFADASSPTSQVSGLSIGVNTFEWTVTSGACTASAQVSISRDEAPTTANAGSNQSVCATSATLSANTPTVGTGQWSVLSGSGTFADSSDPNTSVSDLGTGENIFRWTISNGSCTPSTSEVTIARSETPIDFTAGTNQSVCSASFDLEATLPVGANGLWSVISGTGIFADASSPTSQVSGLSIGVNTFEWTVTSGACTASAQVSISRDETPTTANAGSNQSVCATSATLSANTATVGTGQWSVLSGSGIFADSSDPNTSVSDLGTGENIFRWTVSNGSCTPSTSDVTITRSETPINFTAGTNQSVCTSTFTLQATLPVGATGLWSVISGTGTFADASSPTSQVSGLSIGINTFEWTVTSGACTASAQVSITRDETPTTANAGVNQSVCATSATLSANTPSIGTGQWSVLSGSGTFADSSDPNTSVSDLGTGENIFRWTISNGSCTPSTSDVTITRSETPIDFTAGTNQSVCSASFDLEATLPVGATGLWTVISGTGTFADASSPTSQVSGLNIGINTFEWTVTSGACTASAQVSISRDETPTTANAGSNQSVCATSATLSANAPIVGTGQWSVLSGSGTFADSSDPNTSVSDLGTGENIFRWTISNGSCTPSTSEVTIARSETPIDFTAGTNQSVCSASFDLEAILPVGATGLWTVISGTGIFADDADPESEISGLSIGVNTFEWTVTSGACTASAQVSISRDETPTTANAGVNQSVCATSATLSANTPTIGTGQWSVLSGSGIFADSSDPNTSVSDLGTGDNIFRWTISNGSCTPSTSDVTITRSETPINFTAGTNQSVCSASFDLEATLPVGANGLWSVISGTGTFADDADPESEVSGLSIGVNTFEWTVTSGACTASAQVSITRDEAPTTANAGSNQSVCASSTTLNGNTPAVGTGLWTVVSGTGTFANATQGNTAVSGLSIGPNIFRWTISGTVCPSNSSEVTITRFQEPSIANAGQDQQICANSITLSANTPSVGTGQWTIISGNGTIINPNAPNTLVNGLAVGLNIFQWTISNGTCTPTSDQVIITVDTNPIIANAGSDQNICTPSTNLNANNPGGGTGTWTLISGTGNIANPNSPSSEVNNLGVGPNIFRWTIVNGTCSSSDEVTLNRAQSPTIANAGIDQEICSTSTTLSGNTPLIGNGTWNLISGNGNIQNPSLPNTQVTNLGIGVNIFRWTITNSFCSAEFDEVSIIRFAAPTTSNAGSNQTVCSSTASLSANNPSTGTGTWTVVSGTGNFANPNQANTTVSGLSNGPNVFAWTINNGPCSSTSNVTITREANPSVANAGEDQSVCQESTQLNATILVIGNGVWTLVSGNGVPQNPSNPSTTVVGLGIGQNVFRWTVSNGTCPPSFDEVIINRLSPPQFTSAGTDQQICSTNANLSASTPTIGTGTWTLVSGSGNIAQVNNPNTSVSNIGVGENIFRWTISNGNCPSVFDEVSIIRFANPTPSNAGINQLICDESAQLSANTPSIGTGQWSLLSGGGNIVSTNNPSTVVNNLEIGINIFQWTISNGVCPASVSEVTITRQLAPTEANAGQDQSTCLSTTSLQGNTPQYGNGLWTLISGTGNIETPGSPFTNVTNLSVGPNVFQWTISNGGCPSSSDQVTITRLPQPSTANAGPDQEVCTAQTILNANTPLSGEGFWSVVQGTGSFNDINAANATVSNLSIGLNIFRWTINLGTCNSEDVVSITRIEAPTAANAGPNQQICGTTTQLQANTPVIGNGIWSVVSGTVFFENINNPTTSVSNLSIGNNVLRWTISNGICPPSFSEVAIQVSEDPIVANAGADQQICAATTTLNGNIPALGSGVWSVVSGSGNITNPSASNSTITNIGLGANAFRWTITNGACVTSDIVNIVRDQAPSQANAGTDQLVCSSTATLSATAPSIGLGTWSVISGGASVNNAFLSNSGVTNLSTGQNIFRWTVSNGVCPASTDDVVITRQSNPSTANAGVAQEICSNQAILNAAEPLIGQGVWTLSSGSGTFADANSAQTQVSSLSPGVNVFTWTVSNAPCPASAAQVSITRFQQPSLSNAGPDQQICNDNTILAANNPAVGTGQWSLVSGTGVFTNPNQPNSQVTGLSIGQNVFRWTISNGNCNPTSDEIIVTRLNPLTDVNAGPDQQICANNTQMSASALTGGSSGSWSVVSGSGTFSNPSDPNTTVTGIGPGINVYRWTVSNAACPSVQDEVSVTRFQNPSTANAGTDQSVCSASASLSAVAPTIGTGFWTLVSGSGSIANPSSPNTPVSALQTGQNIFRWTVSNGTCETNSDEVIITRDALPTVANAGSNQEICGSNTTLSANTPVIGTGVWSLVSGEAQIQDPNNPVTQVIAIGAGNTILQWTISNGSCSPSSAQITISKTPPPSPSVAGENQTVCGNLAQLNAEVPAIGIGSWSVVSGSGTFNNPNNPNATASGLQFGENVLRWTISNGNCPPNISTITILAIQAANPPQAGVDIEICGTSGQLQATPASNGQGIWEIISGDIIIDDISLPNSNFSISQPGNANLRWKIINPGCPDQEADLNVTSFALPSIAVAGDDIVDCANSTFLQANTPSIGTGTWSVVNGSGSFANANNPNTLVSGLIAGDNIFQWTISNGVCPPSSDQVMVSIVSDALSTDAGPNQSVCATTTVLNAAIADPGIGVWSVISGTGIFDDANNPNTSVSNLSAGQNVFRWTVTTGTCTANAEVTITRNLPPSAAIAGNDFSVCEGSVNLSATAPQTGTGSWSVFEGSGNIVSPANPLSLVNNLGIGANSFIWTVQSGACPLSSDTVVITRIAPPSIADAGADQNICGSNTQLNANTPQIGIGAWTVLSGEATIMEPDNPLSLVENIGASGAVLQWSISNGICSPSNDQVQIIISPDPTPADAGQDQQICSNSTILQASAPINGTGIWTLIQGNGTIQNPSNANTVVSGLSIGENIFEWTVTSGNCSPSSDQVIITVDDNASIADAGADQEICADETSLNAILPQGATGNWTVVTGNATISDINDPQSGVTGLSNGTNIFRWTIQTGACPASFDEVIITRSIAPSQANAGINQQICANNAQLNAEIPTIGTGSWSVVAGNANIVNAASPSSQVNNLNAGINIFRWTVSNGPCPVSFADVTIQVDSPPSQAIANASAEVCGDEVQLNGQSPAVGVGIWTVASGGALIQNPSSSQTTASGLSSGQNSFQWTVNNGSCAANSITVTVNSFVPPSIADAGEDQFICETSSTLEALAPANGQGAWSVFSGTANIAQINNPQSPVSALSEGVNQLIWTVSNGICPSSSDTLLILVNQEGNLANAGDDQTICSPSTVTNALTPQQGQGQWTLVSGSGNIQDIINPQTNITNIGFGTNIFQWTVSGGLCPSSSDQLVIVRFQPPSIANAGPNQQTCSNSAQLQANSPSIGIGTWQIIQGNGSFSNVNAPNAVVSNLSPGTNILRWSINNGNCPPSTSEVTIIVDDTPVEADAGPDQQICAETTSLSANTPAAGSGIWIAVVGGGIIDNPTSPNTSVSNLQVGVNIFRWEVNNGDCVAQDEVNIIRSLPPSAAVTGTEQIICTSTTTLQANTPQAGTGLWTLISGAGQIQNPSNPNSTVNNIGLGVNVFRWTISNGSCAPSFAELTVIRQAAPTPAIAGNDQQICADQAILSGNIPSSGSGVWSLISGSGTIANALNPNTNVTNLGEGSNVFQWTIISGDCPPSVSQVTIERFAPITNLSAGTDMSICGSALTLNATDPGNASGTWSLISGAGQFFDAGDPNTFVSNLNFGVNIFRWTVSNSVCPSASADVAIVAFAQPAVANAGPDQQLCDTVTTLQANLPDIGSGIWTLVNGSGIIDNPEGNNTLVSDLSAGNNTFRYTITNGVCNTQDEVIITVFAQPAPANAGFDIDVCAETVQLQGAVSASGTLTWSSSDANISFNNINIHNPLVSNLPYGFTEFYLTASNGVCESSTDTMVVFRETEPSAAVVMDNLVICEDFVEINAEAPLIGQGLWNVLSGGANIEYDTLNVSLLTEIAVGTTTLSWTVSNGVCAPNSAILSITRFEQPTIADAGGDQISCFPLDTMQGNFPLVGNGIWTLVSGNANINNPNLPFTTVGFPGPGTVQLAWTITNNICISSDTITINNYETPISDAGFDRAYCEGTNEIELKANTPTVGEGFWLVWDGAGIFADENDPRTTVTGMQEGVNVYEWWVSNGECQTFSQVTITLLPSFAPECQDQTPEVFIPEGFSPNNDGVNDVFVIQLKESKRVGLKIYNRWGNLVFESDDYQNDWNGRSNSPFVVMGDQLPEGTYYYLITIDGEEEPRKGYLTIWR